MTKRNKSIKKELTYVIKLPDGKKIKIGPGISNVPDGKGSPRETDIKKMIKAAREASEAGVFDTENGYYGSNAQSSTR